jgi:formylglycine-generating enzyme required for sulfatase activity
MTLKYFYLKFAFPILFLLLGTLPSLGQTDWHTSGQTKQGGRRHALLIGAKYYMAYPTVSNAEAAVTLLQEDLAKTGAFNEGTIRSMTDADDGTQFFPIAENIRLQFKELAADLKENDAALVFYHGYIHELNSEGDLALVPADGVPTKGTNFIPISWLYENCFSQENAKQVLLIIQTNKALKREHRNWLNKYIRAQKANVVLISNLRNTAQQMITAINGAADYLSFANRDHVITPEELTEFISLQVSVANDKKDHLTYWLHENNQIDLAHFFTDANAKEQPVNQIVTKLETFLTAFTDIKTLKQREAKRVLSDTQTRREAALLLIKQGSVQAAIKALGPLTDTYLETAKNIRLQERIHITKQEVNKAQTKAKKLGATQKAVEAYTKGVQLTTQAEGLETGKAYKEALNKWEEAKSVFRQVCFDIVKQSYNKRLDQYNRDTLRTNALPEWNAVSTMITDAKQKFSQGEFEDAISAVAKAEEKLKIVARKASNALYKTALKFDNKEDYNTALHLLKKLFALSPDHVEAKSLQRKILSNYRFKRGEKFTNKLGMNFVYVPTSTFTVGTPEDEFGRGSDERQFKANITHGYFIGVYEVSRAEWDKVMGASYRPEQGVNPFDAKLLKKRSDDSPKTSINWKEANLFCKRLSELCEGEYRLPTEAEWELACRAGTKTPFNNGKITLTAQDAVIYNDANPYNDVRPVGSVGSPNQLGIHDMHGNVWEWCQDWMAPYPKQETPVKNPSGPQKAPKDLSQATRVMRGGSWIDDWKAARSGNRGENLPTVASTSIGFRVVLEAASLD